jgi:hypothetical protein
VFRFDSNGFAALDVVGSMTKTLLGVGALLAVPETAKI